MIEFVIGVTVGMSIGMLVQKGIGDIKKQYETQQETIARLQAKLKGWIV